MNKLLGTLVAGCLTLLGAALSPAPAAAAPSSAVFTITPAQSSLTVGATYSVFSDTDTKNLAGTINATFDFGGAGFGTPAQVTITGANIVPQGNYQLTLGFPPVLGVSVTGSGLVADIATAAPPATMTRTALPATYQAAASQFEVIIDQGTVTATGAVNESANLAEQPVSGTPSSGNLTFTFTAGAVSGPYTRLNGTLNFPIAVADTLQLEDGSTVDVTLNGTVVATTAFYAALNGVPGDFNDDGAVNQTDLGAWKTGYGTATGASRSQGDANGDGDVDGDDFLVWQRNVGIAPPPIATAAAAAIPEPSTAAGLAIGLAIVAAGRRCIRRSRSR
jgi:hypothetical protein